MTCSQEIKVLAARSVVVIVGSTTLTISTIRRISKGLVKRCTCCLGCGSTTLPAIFPHSCSLPLVVVAVVIVVEDIVELSCESTQPDYSCHTTTQNRT